MSDLRPVALAGLVVLALAGCGGGAPAPAASAPESAPALPPRPATLTLEGVDVCGLLTPVQRGQLGVNGGRFDGQDFGGPLKGPSCTWSNGPRSPDNAYTGGAVLNHGAEFALGREPLRSVDGYAATTTGSAGSDLNYYCLMLVDVAPGQALAAQYDNGAKDSPGMNRQTACGNAQRLAKAMLSTLRAQQVR